MKKVLWFSRHSMSKAQLNNLTEKLGEIEVTQLNASPANVHVPFRCADVEVGETTADFILALESEPLKVIVQEFDEVAVVLPIGMLQQLLPFAPAKRLLQAKNKRVLLKDGKVQFIFDGWEAVTKVEIVTSPL